MVLFVLILLGLSLKGLEMNTNPLFDALHWIQKILVFFFLVQNHLYKLRLLFITAHTL